MLGHVYEYNVHKIQKIYLQSRSIYGVKSIDIYLFQCDWKNISCKI